MPDDVADPGAVHIINLDYPALVADREEKIAVIGRVHDGVGVGPIRITHKGTSDIQMIKAVPHPPKLESSVALRNKLDERVADDRGGGCCGAIGDGRTQLGQLD